MAIIDTTKPMICQWPSSLPEMSSSVQEHFMEKAARVSAMKSRYAGLINKAEQILNVKDKSTDEEDPPEKLNKTTSTSSEVDHVQRESSDGLQSKIKKHQEVGSEGDHHHRRRRHQLVIRRSQEVLERRREADDNRFLRTKKRQESDVQREAEDETLYFKKKRQQEIERQRKAARIAISKITKTVDFENLSVMVEFERLLCC